MYFVFRGLNSHSMRYDRKGTELLKITHIYSEINSVPGCNVVVFEICCCFSLLLWLVIHMLLKFVESCLLLCLFLAFQCLRLNYDGFASFSHSEFSFMSNLLQEINLNSNIYSEAACLLSSLIHFVRFLPVLPLPFKEKWHVSSRNNILTFPFATLFKTGHLWHSK